jgi:AbrB family looped-hinge helix DNA binding protein
MKMKTTGIVRRVDDLGRIVIPREVRKSMGLKDGTPFEVFTSTNGDIIFKPFNESKFKIDNLIGIFKECNQEEQKEILKRLIDEWNKK